MNFKRLIFILFLFIFILKFAFAFTPSPSSPAGQGIHPRLHITPDSIDEMRAKVAGPNKIDYQALVDAVVKDFSKDTLTNDATSGIAADYHALIYLLGPVPGINYGGKSVDDFGIRAVEIMMNLSSNPVDCGIITSTEVEDFHNGDDNYANLARAYDWVFNYPGFTTSQKQIVAKTIAQSGLCMGGARLFSSSFHSPYKYPWYLGLSIYADGFADEDATLLVNKFEQHMINGGALDAHNFVAQKKGGGPEVIAYEYGQRGKRYIFFIDGWRTGTGQDYFATGTEIANAAYHRNYGRYFTYVISPWDRKRILKWGQMSVGDCGNCDSLFFLRLNAGAIQNIDPDLASLATWHSFINGAEGKIRSMAAENMLSALLGDRSIVPKSPTQINLPLTEYFEGLGLVFARSGFENKDDLAFVVGGPPYNYEGHSWDRSNDLIFGFQLDKYGGPLVFKKVYYHRNYASMHRQNIMRFTDPASPDLLSGINPTPFSGYDIRLLTPNSHYYKGGTERYLPLSNLGSGKFDYIYTDIGRFYDSKVKQYTRQYLLFRPSSWEQSDYIVIFDRVETSKPETIKRWLLNIAYDPVINGIANPVREGKTTYTGADQITITNKGIDPYYNCPSTNPICYQNSFNAHGNAFVKTLLPSQVKIDKIGGPYHEFESDLGELTNFNDVHGSLRGHGAFYVGAYTLEVIPTQSNPKENFLHVMQVADANSVSSMVQTTLIESTEGKMQGAYITKTTGQDNTVAMFAKTEEVLDLAGQTITYRYGAGNTGLTRHVISDLKANHPYTITDKNVASGQTTTQTLSTSDLRTDFAKEAGEPQSGILSFTTNPLGEHQITITQQGSSINFAPEVYLSADRFSTTPPGKFTLTALATDQGGSIVKVEFYNGATMLSSDAAMPYTHSWSNVAAGSYSLTAKAYDNSGLTVVSKPVNLFVGITADKSPPSVSLTAPAKFTFIGPGSTLSIAATASDSHDSSSGMSKVNFKFDGTIIGTHTSAPYSITWTAPSGLMSGNHIITAEAIDIAGNKQVSSNLVVRYSADGTNQLPLGSLEEITALGEIRGWTFDPDHSSELNKYALYIDGPMGAGTLVANTSTNTASTQANIAFGITGSHGFRYDKLPAQYKDGKPHTVYAYGFDLNDPTKFTELANSPKTFIFNQTISNSPPSVFLTSPSNNQMFTIPATIVLTATASDTDGTVTRVEFYANGNLLNTDTSSPYSFTWNNPTAGAYSLIAKAHDSSGAATTSTPINIVINGITSTESEIIIDNANLSAVTILGSWLSSSSVSGYYGNDYIHDDNKSKGAKSVKFTPNIPTAGTYDIYARWTASVNRATNVPIRVQHQAGTTTYTVNQQLQNGIWVLLGTHILLAGTSNSVEIRNDGTINAVIADAVKFVPIASQTPLEGDLNGDRNVNIQDILMIVYDFGKTSGFSPAVDKAAPFSEIDIFDVMFVVRNWGRTG